MMPPFGRGLTSRRANSNGEVFIYFGSDGKRAWQLAKCRDSVGLPVLLLPHNKQADNYSWPLNGWAILALQVGKFSALELPKLALAFLNAGAHIVKVIPAPSYHLVIFGGKA